MAGITLHAKHSGAVYCYRSCLFAMGGRALFVGGSVTTITRNCVHQSSPGFVDKGSDHLQLINDMQTPGKGICSGPKIFGSGLLQPSRSVCVSLRAFFIVFRFPLCNIFFIFFHFHINSCHFVVE